ncbi:PsiF family protein [soil metagenome]
MSLIRTLAVATILAVAAPAGFAADAAKTPTPQQAKMKACNADAAGKTGDERKAFMSSCLSNKKLTSSQTRMKTCNAQAQGKTGDERKTFMSTCLKAT